VDAAYDPSSEKGATEAIIRDSGENFIAAACDHTDYAMEVAAMDTTTLLAGLKLAEQFGANSLMVETYSMEVVEVILNPMENRGSYAVIIDDCGLLLEELGSTTLQHCAREANDCWLLLEELGRATRQHCLLITTLCRVLGSLV
jgi:predicted regulator of Ras-like GTPase activity (Roadblock/LC7/MglB family)